MCNACGPDLMTLSTSVIFLPCVVLLVHCQWAVGAVTPLRSRLTVTVVKSQQAAAGESVDRHSRNVNLSAFRDAATGRGRGRPVDHHTGSKYQVSTLDSQAANLQEKRPNATHALPRHSLTPHTGSIVVHCSACDRDRRPARRPTTRRRRRPRPVGPPLPLSLAFSFSIQFCCAHRHARAGPRRERERAGGRKRAIAAADESNFTIDN